VAHDFAINLSYQRQLQGVGCAQRFHDEVFSLMTERMVLEGHNVDFTDGIEIPWSLRANDHMNHLPLTASN